MKFIVSSTALLKQLQNLIGVINAKNTLPILDNFLFSVTGNELTITASDVETTMSGTVEVQSEFNGKIAINARLLLDAIKTFADQPLTFILNQENKTLEITADVGEYDTAYFDGDEFPEILELENPASTEIPADVLVKGIEKTLFAIANDDLRPAMNGVLFQFNPNQLIFVATDAHKLVKYTRNGVNTSEVAEFIVPKKPLSILKNVLAGVDSAVRIEYNKTNVKFSFDNTVLVCRLIEGKYPNYEAVIPKENPNKLIVNRDNFLLSIRRASVFSNKSTHQVKLTITGQVLNIKAEDIDFSNRADEEISCNYDGEDMQIGFNSKFLLEMLLHLDSEEIQLEMSLPTRAGILTPVDGLEEGEEILMLVMPVMIANG